jgi:hypothetical protein
MQKVNTLLNRFSPYSLRCRPRDYDIIAGLTMRIWQKTLLTIVALYGILCAAALAVMYQTPERFSRVMIHVPDVAFIILPFKPLWFTARAGRLHVGDTAPGFSLPTQDQKNSVQLASFRTAEPVVLVFGSYT